MSNDDGIEAAGIQALSKALIREDFADVLVCAPDTENSGRSQAITLGRRLSCNPYDELPGGSRAQL